jgi:hypothetical protein
VIQQNTEYKVHPAPSIPPPQLCQNDRRNKGIEMYKSTKSESKEKHGVWDPMPELTLTLYYVHSRVDSKTFTMGNLCQHRP